MSLAKRLPESVRLAIDRDPYYRYCARDSEDCAGRITMEHAVTYAGKRINELWAIIPLCERHHGLGEWFMNGSLLNKRKNMLIALRRAPECARRKYPKLPWHLV